MPSTICSVFVQAIYTRTKKSVEVQFFTEGRKSRSNIWLNDNTGTTIFTFQECNEFITKRKAMPDHKELRQGFQRAIRRV